MHEHGGAVRYRQRVNALALISAAAFAGGNLFIGLSMGSYWLGLEPSRFYAVFWPQWLSFLLTILPLFLVMPVGLLLSARLDWSEQALKRRWLIALALYVAVTLITAMIHLPLNLQIGAAVLAAEGKDVSAWWGVIGLFGHADPAAAAANRAYWLMWHVPRILITAAMPLVIMGAIHRRRHASA